MEKEIIEKAVRVKQEAKEFNKQTEKILKEARRLFKK